MWFQTSDVRSVSSRSIAAEVARCNSFMFHVETPVLLRHIYLTRNMQQWLCETRARQLFLPSEQGNAVIRFLQRLSDAPQARTSWGARLGLASLFATKDRQHPPIINKQTKAIKLPEDTYFSTYATLAPVAFVLPRMRLEVSASKYAST